MTQIVSGVHLPDDDRHFAEQVRIGPWMDGRGSYKRDKLLQAIVAIGDRRGHAVDVGAHVGLWSWPLAIRFRHLTAFEPVPELAECWRINMAGRDNTELRTYGLGAESATAAFVSVPDGEGTIKWTDSGTWAVIERLDNQGLAPIDFLKVSCDGCEMPVIQGGEQTICRDKPVIVVQSKRKRSDVYGYPRDGALDLLKSWGAEIAWSMHGDYCLVFPA